MLIFIMDLFEVDFLDCKIESEFSILKEKYHTVENKFYDPSREFQSKESFEVRLCESRFST